MIEETLQAEEPADAATPPSEVVESAPTEEENVETAPESEDSPEEKPKPKGGFQRRIDELTRNWRESERRVDQLMEYVTQMKAAGASPQQVEDAVDSMPTLEQFGYDESKYQSALLKYAESVADKKVSARLSEWEQRQQQQVKQMSFLQREAEFAATVDDYEDKVKDPSLPISQSMAEAIAESDIGPKLAYHLAEHRDLAAKIAAMSPIQAAREIGKIEARLSAPPPKPVTKAPPPPPKLDAADHVVDVDPSSMTDAQFKKWREKQIAQRR